MTNPREDEEEPALTPALRDVMRPRTGRLLIALVAITLALAGLLLMASRSGLARLWR